MEKNDHFQPTGKRLDNLNRLLKSEHPKDLWIMDGILPPFLSIIDSYSTLQQQRAVMRELKQLFDAYESVAGIRPDYDIVRWWEILGTLKWGIICISCKGN